MVAQQRGSVVGGEIDGGGWWNGGCVFVTEVHLRTKQTFARQLGSTYLRIVGGSVRVLGDDFLRHPPVLSVYVRPPCPDPMQSRRLRRRLILFVREREARSYLLLQPVLHVRPSRPDTVHHLQAESEGEGETKRSNDNID